MKWGLKGGISIDADSGPPRYVLWCCGGICHELLTFIQIGCGHTVICFISRILISTRGKYSRPNFCQGVVLHFFFTLRFLMYVCTYWILFWNLLGEKNVGECPDKNFSFFMYIFFYFAEYLWLKYLWYVDFSWYIW